MKNLLALALLVACSLTMTIGCGGDAPKPTTKNLDSSKDAPMKDKMVPPGKTGS